MITCHIPPFDTQGTMSAQFCDGGEGVTEPYPCVAHDQISYRSGREDLLMGTAVISACILTAASSPTSVILYRPYVLTASGPVEDDCTDDHWHRGFRCQLTVFAAPLP